MTIGHDSNLISTSQEWSVAFWHPPPYSWGGHIVDNENGEGQIRVTMCEEVLTIVNVAGGTGSDRCLPLTCQRPVVASRTGVPSLQWPIEVTPSPSPKRRSAWVPR